MFYWIIRIFKSRCIYMRSDKTWDKKSCLLWNLSKRSRFMIKTWTNIFQCAQKKKNSNEKVIFFTSLTDICSCFRRKLTYLSFFFSKKTRLYFFILHLNLDLRICRYLNRNTKILGKTFIFAVDARFSAATLVSALIYDLFKALNCAKANKDLIKTVWKKLIQKWH